MQKKLAPLSLDQFTKFVNLYPEPTEDGVEEPEFNMLKSDKVEFRERTDRFGDK